MKANEVEVELVSGKKTTLDQITDGVLGQVKLTQNKKGQESLPMKSGVMKETPTHLVERRLFKWGPMPSPLVYDLPIPKGDQWAADYPSDWEGWTMSGFRVDADKQAIDKKFPSLGGEKVRQRNLAEDVALLRLMPQDLLEQDHFRPVLDDRAKRNGLSVAELLEKIAASR